MMRKNLPMIIASIFTAALLHAQANVPPVPSMTIVKTDKPPVVDGVVEPDEWRQSAVVTGFCDAGRSLSPRQPLVYFTYDDQFLYFAMVSKMEKGEKLRANIGKDDHRLICMDDSFELYFQPVPEKPGLEYYYQILGNSRGAVLDNASEPFGQNNLGWDSQLDYQSKIDGDHWSIEGKVPWSVYKVDPSDLKKNGYRMNICRNGYKSATSWSWTTKFANLNRAGNVAFANGEIAVKVLDVKELLIGNGRIAGTVFNGTGKSVDLLIRLDVDGQKVEKELTVTPGKNDEWEVNVGHIETEKFNADLSISDKRNGKILLNQTIPVVTNVKAKIFTNPPEPVGFKAGFSRISNAINASIDIFHFSDKDSVCEARLMVAREIGGKKTIVGEKRINTFKKGIAEAFIYLNSDFIPGQNCKYIINLKLLDKQGKTLYDKDAELEVKTFKWENNKIGVSDKILSPFTPLKLKDDTVECWNRFYKFNPDAFLAKITSGAETVLIDPMIFKAVIDGRTCLSKPIGDSTIIENKPDEVVLSGNGSIGEQLDYHVRSKVEYDGLVAFSVTLLPRKTIRIQELRLIIPINDSCASYIDATGDYIRKNAYCGPLKKNQGRVWSSSQHRNMKVKGSFIPFIWLSNDTNGLCWLAESDRGWSLDPDKSALTLERHGDVVELNMNIVNKSVVLDHAVTFEFVLQATPVKPMIKGWRLSGIGNGRDTFPGQDNDRIFLWFNWGTPGRWKIDKTYEKVVGLANKNGAHSCIYNNWSAFPYSLNSVDRQAVNSFLGDWQGGIMTKSVQDAVLYYADKLLEAGEIGGIYCDDTWPQASENILNHSAYVMENGEIQPGFGILKQREYAKRVAHMLEKYKKRPGLWIHDTHALIAPYLAFADISMDGEDHPLTTLRPDFIDQWSFERLRAGAMGEKIGTIPFWLPLVRVPNTKENQKLRAKLTRTTLGPLMLHDYITYYSCSTLERDVLRQTQKAKFDFGIGDDSVTFHPYWNNSEYVKANPSDIYVSFYKNNRRLLMIALNKSEKETTATLDIDFQKLGFNKPVAKNAETGEIIAINKNTIQQKIPYHDFLLIRVDEEQ